jgi:hypothetical protein
MKKIISIFALVSMIAVFASSCKTHEKCPAYGNAVKAKVHNRV